MVSVSILDPYSIFMLGKFTLPQSITSTSSFNHSTSYKQFHKQFFPNFYFYSISSAISFLIFYFTTKQALLTSPQTNNTIFLYMFSKHYAVPKTKTFTYQTNNILTNAFAWCEEIFSLAVDNLFKWVDVFCGPCIDCDYVSTWRYNPTATPRRQYYHRIPLQPNTRPIRFSK